MNSFVCIGRLAQDPELNNLTSGTPVARFTLADSRVYQQKKVTDFFDFQAYGATAEFVSKHFHKGDPIAVHGTAREDKWVSQDGTKRRKVVFNVQNVSFVPNKPNPNNQLATAEAGVSETCVQQELDF